ncbi:MAG: hypothetical protein AB7Q17_10765 [Phycisphaerae bacterium]
MTRPIAARARRAMMLPELVIILTSSVAAIWLLTKLFADTLYVHRVCVQHFDRMVVLQELSAALRRDAWSAVDADWDADASVLRIRASNAFGAIAYQFEPERVVRTVAGRESGVWHTTRLVFEAGLQRGATGDLLLVSAVEAPPARNQRNPVAHVLSFVLPRSTCEMEHETDPREPTP